MLLNPFPKANSSGSEFDRNPAVAVCICILSLIPSVSLSEENLSTNPKLDMTNKDSKTTPRFFFQSD